MMSLKKLISSVTFIGRRMGQVNVPRKFDSLGGITKKFDSLSGSVFGTQKRNFDEIDNAGFGMFVKKNNYGDSRYPKRFDEIDNSGFGAFKRSM